MDLFPGFYPRYRERSYSVELAAGYCSLPKGYHLSSTLDPWIILALSYLFLSLTSSYFDWPWLLRPLT